MLGEWYFTTGLEEWAASNPEEMNIDVRLSSSGELTGSVLGDFPHFDSPPLRIHAIGQHYVVMRMLYSGTSEQGQVHVLTEANPTFSSAHRINFPIITDGNYRVYYIPLWEQVSGVVTRLRIYPAYHTTDRLHPKLGDAFSVDWIMVAVAPTVNRVTGCIDKFFSSSDFSNAISSITATEIKTNGYHQTIQTSFLDSDMPFASTYNCLRRGGETITIVGENFAESDAIVLINGVPCTDVIHLEPNVKIQCTLPPGEGSPSQVIVKNGKYNGLFCTTPTLSYAAPPVAPLRPTLTNLATHSVDVNWLPPASVWEALAITGYQIHWKSIDDVRFNTVVVGNVTTTTISGLLPNVEYEFKVAAMSEDQVSSTEWRQLDLYGRRSSIPGAVLGHFSPVATATQTLVADFWFTKFDANSTLNHGAVAPGTSLGATGELGGQGHYGLHIVGDANVRQLVFVKFYYNSCS